MGSILTLNDVRLTGRRVLLRLDVNSPLDPATKEFLDDTRFRAALPTLRRLADAQVIILAHQSRPNRVDFTTMERHADRLSRLLGREITYIPDVCGEVAQNAIRNMQQGDMLFFDNVRRHPDEMAMKKAGPEELSASEIVSNLAPLVDAYVTDAFAAAHRKSPTLCGFGPVLPCIAGELMATEVLALKKAVENPPKPYTVVLGGVKCDDSLEIATHLASLDLADHIVPVGAVGNLMLWASGIDIGPLNKDFLRNELGNDFEDTWVMANALIEHHSERLLLPIDVAAEIDGSRVDVDVGELPVDGPLLDIGLGTLMHMQSAIMDVGCVVWNGPAGYFENPDFAFGTIEILNQCCESDAFVIIGGGHTSSLVSERKVEHLVSHSSTGGGACLTMLAGKPMPGISALEVSARLFSDSLGDLASR